MPYINKVLDQWQKKEIRTPEKAREDREKKSKRQIADQTRATSYDIDEIQKLLGNQLK